MTFDETWLDEWRSEPRAWEHAAAEVSIGAAMPLPQRIEYAFGLASTTSLSPPERGRVRIPASRVGDC
jgi:hypothetical protein